MNHVRSAAYDSSRHLPHHHRLLQTLFKFFKTEEKVRGCFLQGAAATGGLHPFSDLDFGILCATAELRNSLLQDLVEWDFAPEMKFLGIDEKNQFRANYLGQPHIHVHLNFYANLDLPRIPVVVAWDTSGQLDLWVQKMSWAEVVHEDEQFWVWTHFSAMHAARGDFHDVMGHLEDLRGLVQNWQSRLDQMSRANFKKMGQRFQPEFLDRMKRTYCPPHAEAVKVAYQNLIKIQLQQRALIERAIAPKWAVSLPTISKIQTFSQNFNDLEIRFTE